MIDERYRMWYVFRSCGSKTMINVLSYFYGKWVWLLWCLLAVCSVAVGASMLPAVGSKPARTLYLSALFLFGTIVLMPCLNGCALVLDSCAGPPFAGWGATTGS